jgi:hypothetical protein
MRPGRSLGRLIGTRVAYALTSSSMSSAIARNSANGSCRQRKREFWTRVHSRLTTWTDDLSLLSYATELPGSSHPIVESLTIRDVVGRSAALATFLQLLGLASSLNWPGSKLGRRATLSLQTPVLWRLSHVLLKVLGKLKSGMKPKNVRDFLHRMGRICQKFLSFLQADLAVNESKHTGWHGCQIASRAAEAVRQLEVFTKVENVRANREKRVMLRQSYENNSLSGS